MPILHIAWDQSVLIAKPLVAVKTPPETFLVGDGAKRRWKDHPTNELEMHSKKKQRLNAPSENLGLARYSLNEYASEVMETNHSFRLALQGLPRAVRMEMIDEYNTIMREVRTEFTATRPDDVKREEASPRVIQEMRELEKLSLQERKEWKEKKRVERKMEVRKALAYVASQSKLSVRVRAELLCDVLLIDETWAELKARVKELVKEAVKEEKRKAKEEKKKAKREAKKTM